MKVQKNVLIEDELIKQIRLIHPDVKHAGPLIDLALRFYIENYKVSIPQAYFDLIQQIVSTELSGTILFMMKKQNEMLTAMNERLKMIEENTTLDYDIEKIGDE